jgi:ABC-type phosphate transport system substrate-binding protein
MKRILMLAALCLVASAVPAARAGAQGFTIIVNAANPVASLSKSQVSGYFLKQAVKWEDGKPVVPVDQDKGSKAREGFTKAVHGRSVSAVHSYWQQQIFCGKDVPPTEKPGDADVVAFVKGNPNAIGYVAAGATLGDGVKAVAIK